MTETDNGAARVPSTDSSQKRERKRRKWDQPAESFVSVGLPIPGVLPVTGMGAIPGLSYPALPNPIVGSSGTGQLAPSGVVKPKIQDELIIAREIVINDADPSVRYKLTKRQTQEEIQRSTGAVVITRGKYRPPNTPPDGEKPLYLHISAASHLKETAERILAVDRAAAMVEEMLKHGPNLQSSFPSSHPPISNGLKTLSTCVFLGFEPDPSLDIASRIRGPNDQYINHIMNTTGATVLLRGRGSGNLEKQLSEEGQQPLHLLLSSNNPKGLEDAKRLAENLLDTISAEFGATRVSSTKVYGAVPPPQQLVGGVQNAGNDLRVNTSSTSVLTSSSVSTVAAPPYPLVTVPQVTTAVSLGTVSQSGGFLNYGKSQPNLISHPQPSMITGTSYSGYEGIYPQVTHLQQVALALRQSCSPTISTVNPTTLAQNNAPNPPENSNQEEKRPPQKRKFQELPISSKDPAKALQGSGPLKPSDPTADVVQRDISAIPAPKKLSNGTYMPLPKSMPPPPPPPKFIDSMPRPPPPPKFNDSMPRPPPPPKFSDPVPAAKVNEKNSAPQKISSADSVPDTLVKLMEYGDEDDDSEETSAGSSVTNLSNGATPKPFWAV